MPQRRSDPAALKAAVDEILAIRDKRERCSELWDGHAAKLLRVHLVRYLGVAGEQTDSGATHDAKGIGRQRSRISTQIAPTDYQYGVH